MASLMTVFVTERYRMPIVPGLLIFAAFGLSFFWRSLISGEYLRSSAYLGLLCASTLFVSWPQRDRSLWALDAYNSGWQALESNNLALAAQKLELAHAYVPTNPETNFALGNLKLAEGNREAAAAFYFSTLKFDETHRGALNNLGVLALEEQHVDAAEKWFRRALSLDPRNAKTHFLLARALQAQGDLETARREAEVALQLQPRQPEFEQLRAQIEATMPH
jgi:Flp pilus assembly protein TadD